MNAQTQQLIARSHKVPELIFPRNGFINGKRFDVLATIDGLAAVARNSGFLEKVEYAVEEKAVPMLVDGLWIERTDLVATCSVYRKDWRTPVTSTVSLHEYIKTDRRGNQTFQWRRASKRLLLRIAAAQALRKAFNVPALYIPEEVGVGMTIGKRLILDRDEDTKIISAEQLHELRMQFKQLNVVVPAFCDYFGIMDVAELPVARYREALSLLNRKKQRLAAQTEFRKAA